MARAISKTTGLWDLLRQMAARPDGFSTKEVIDSSTFTLGQVSVACTTLRERGELVTYRISHRYARYFADPAAMAAFKHALEAKQRAQLASKHRRQHGLVANWANQEAVIPPHVKVQVIETPAPKNTSYEFPFIRTRKGL